MTIQLYTLSVRVEFTVAGFANSFKLWRVAVEDVLGLVGTMHPVVLVFGEKVRAVDGSGENILGIQSDVMLGCRHGCRNGGGGGGG